MSAPVPDRSLDSLDHNDSRDKAPLYTSARISLNRTGVSIATRHALEFSLAHARARDAVHTTLAVTSLMAALRERELAAVAVHSAASTRIEYLRRPDLGRTLAAISKELLAKNQGIPSTEPGVPSTEPSAPSTEPSAPSTDPGGPSTDPGGPFMQSHRMGGLSFAVANDRRSHAQPATTLAIILADGLSALAVERHALLVLDALLPLLDDTWQLAPIVVAEQARVALGDEIGAALHADVTVMLIGERPGLSSPDSLGAYITWGPRAGRTDAERNCVSNIRTEGLDYAAAAAKIAWYITEGRRLGLTGVKLRGSDAVLLP